VNAFRTADERVAAIAEVAYRLWEERGRPDGSAAEDWYRAELIIDRREDRGGGKRDALDTPRGRTRRKSTLAVPTLVIATTGAHDRNRKAKGASGEKSYGEVSRTKEELLMPENRSSGVWDSDSSGRIAPANKIAGVQPSRFATWARGISR
jgi:hypothetical protein